MQHMQIGYISTGMPLPSDALMHDLPELHNRSYTATMEAMRRMNKQQHEESRALSRQTAVSQHFLDDVSNDSERRAEVDRRELLSDLCRRRVHSAPASS